MYLPKWTEPLLTQYFPDMERLTDWQLSKRYKQATSTLIFNDTWSIYYKKAYQSTSGMVDLYAHQLMVHLDHLHIQLNGSNTLGQASVLRLIQEEILVFGHDA